MEGWEEGAKSSLGARERGCQFKEPVRMMMRRIGTRGGGQGVDRRWTERNRKQEEVERGGG